MTSFWRPRVFCFFKFCATRCGSIEVLQPWGIQLEIIWIFLFPHRLATSTSPIDEAPRQRQRRQLGSCFPFCPLLGSLFLRLALRHFLASLQWKSCIVDGIHSDIYHHPFILLVSFLGASHIWIPAPFFCASFSNPMIKSSAQHSMPFPRLFISG